jgi:class 3 adenylate cyclase
MGRLILFDKRGTGLSDRVLGIASLEERMDDVRAVRGHAPRTHARARDGSQPLPRARARRSPGRIRAGFDGPARAVRCATALADNVPALRAGIHTGECEVHDGTLSGPALAVATYLAGTASPGEVLATSTVQDLVAGSGIDLDERGTLGELRLFSVLR